MKITKIYTLFTDDEFLEVPTDGSALVRFFEDIYVYHEGYWRMVKYEPFGDHPRSIDLGKPVPYDDEGQVYSVAKAEWVFIKKGEIEQ